MINIAVVEDDIDYIQTLGTYVKRFAEEKGLSIKVDSYSSSEEFLFSYEPKYDIILMDIEMPRMDGMTCAMNIRKTDSDVIIIFVTNMAQYAINGYKVRARAYILKPINYYSFTLELNDAINNLSKRNTGHILIQTTDGLKKINTDDILYVEVQRHQVFFHTI